MSQTRRLAAILAADVAGYGGPGRAHNVVRDFTSLPVQPILLRGQLEFVSLPHLKRFPWLLPSFEYDTEEHLLANLDQKVVGPAEAKVLEIRDQPR